ncbi:hypothetical protein A6A29_08700 [Streptomyces sp. TSRI0281]|nr:hypothetical protein A6A29_08700 [Streptomyces sp. TSRI0281]
MAAYLDFAMATLSSVAGCRRVPSVFVDSDIPARQPSPAAFNNCCRETSIKPDWTVGLSGGALDVVLASERVEFG